MGAPRDAWTSIVNAPALKPFRRYDFDSSQSGSLAYTFTFGAAAFFVLDTRTLRIKQCRERLILGEEQWQSLETWLLSVKDAYPVKFSVSSGAVLYRLFLDFPDDRWSGFPRERNRLLELLATNGIEGVYLLIGDLHTSHAVRAELYGPQGKSLPLWEFCSTPFEQEPKHLTRLIYNPFRFGQVRDLQR